MIFVDFDNFLRASYSFAVEEYLLSNPTFKDDYFLLWRTTPTLMIGRFQNTYEEINIPFVNENNMAVVRRNSGGGTIYTDQNCWQFSFITWKGNNFRNFTKPVIDALAQMGINTEFSGRNDLMLNGKKFSGNAQYTTKDRFLHHGSILFDANLDMLVKSITIGDDKIISKGVKSIKDRVVNIKDFLFNPQISSLDFKNVLLDFLSKEMPTITLNNYDLSAVDGIEKQKFLSWDWNFGKSPEFNITKSKRFEGGKIETLLNVKHGIIVDCNIRGDFFFLGNIADFKNEIIGTKYDKQAISALFDSIDIEKYFYLIRKDELIEIFV